MTEQKSATERAEELIAQQLPSLETLEKLFESVAYTRDITDKKSATLPTTSAMELNEFHLELRAKIDELLNTEYNTTLYLLLLPLLIEIKKKHNH